MKVLVTGAVGRLGSVTCHALAEAGLEVTGLDRYYNRDLPCPLVVADLLDDVSLYSHVEGMDAVVHLANYSNVRAAPPDRLYPENMKMNFNMFRVAGDVGVSKVLFASSIQAMHGRRRSAEEPSALPYLPIDGNTPATTDNLYGLSKIHGEQLLQFLVEEGTIPSGIALRFPYLGTWSGWKSIRSRRPVMMTPTAVLDEAFTMLDPVDAARLMIAILRTDLPGYRCYLPAAPAVKSDESVEYLIKTYYPDVELRRPIADMTSLVDTSRITEETGWSPAPVTDNNP